MALAEVHAVIAAAAGSGGGRAETMPAGGGACPWCGASLAGAPSVGRPGAEGYGRVGCTACGVQVTSPWPNDAALDLAYGTHYRPAGGRFGGPGDAVLRRSRSVLAGRLDRIAPAGPVLDVGSGDGVLVEALRARKREARGLERGDPEVTEIGGTWAAVVFWHSLEHLREPGRSLDAAAALLAPGGVLVVAIPNAGSLQARRFGSAWFALDLPRHLTHIPAGALEQRVRSLGLRPRRVSHWRGGQVLFGWLHGLSGGRLYDAIRRPEARSAPLSPGQRLAILARAALVLPLAMVAAAVEVAARRGGTVYLEATR